METGAIVLIVVICLIGLMSIIKDKEEEYIPTTTRSREVVCVSERTSELIVYTVSYGLPTIWEPYQPLIDEILIDLGEL